MRFDKNFLNLLKTPQKFLLTTHLYPDGDAVGSMMGLAKSLRKNGSTVDLALTTPVGDRYSYLLENESILTPEDLTGPYDAVIILDIGSEDRSGFQEKIWELGAPRVNIDHHQTNDFFGDYNAVDTGASSTCEMIYYIIRDADLPMDREIAEAIFLGLVTDSRFFQNSNVRPDTFIAASNLLSTGFDYQTLVRKLNLSRDYLDLKVLGLALSEFETFLDGKIVITKLRQNDLKKLNATHRHAWSGGVFGYLISLETALVAVSFIEAENNKVFCEFRAKNGFDVSEIAKSFGGGGHRSASGCSMERPIDEFAQDVLAKLEILIDHHFNKSSA